MTGRVAVGPVLVEDDPVRLGRVRLSVGAETRSLSAAELCELAADLNRRGARDVVERERHRHWLTFDADRNVVGCHCGFTADVDTDCGWGDSVANHLIAVGAGAGAGQGGGR